MSLNIIANNCIGSYIQRDYLKQELANPFTWATVSVPDMKKLIYNYDKINFKNFRLITYKGVKYISVDKTFVIKYVHYAYDKNAREKIIKENHGSVTIYWDKIDNYIIEKYKARTNRMINNNNEPIFIIGNFFKDQYINYEDAKEIASKSKYKIIFVTDDTRVNELKNDNFDVVIYNMKDLEGVINKTAELAKLVYTQSSFLKT